MTQARADVVICGGGVIGAAVAYFLAKRGVRPVIVEADAVASGASGAAAGLLSPPPAGDEGQPLFELRRRSFELHEELARTLPLESGVDYGYSRVPRLAIATTEEEERTGRLAAERMRDAGRQGRWLGPAEIRAACDWIDGPARGGLLAEDPGQLDPYRYTLALVTAAERMGATVRSGRVTGLERSLGRVTGVRVGGAVIPAGAVLVAMGPWSAEAASWLGSPVPVEPLKGQIVKVRPPAELTAFGFTYGGNYATTKEAGLVYLGTTEERVGFDVGTTIEARDAILRFGVGLASVLGQAELVEQTACLRPLSADGLPIMGAVPGLDGAYVATGHGRQGILMSTATGRAMADLIVDGETDCVDLTPFEPARFGAGVA